MTSGSVTSPVFGLGIMVRRRWKEPAPSPGAENEGVTVVESDGWLDED
jgi:hypothetical protein